MKKVHKLITVLEGDTGPVGFGNCVLNI